MMMENRDVRMKLYKEYEELDDQYRKLASKLKPFMRTSKNAEEFDKFLEVGTQLDTKHGELMKAFGIKRIPLE